MTRALLAIISMICAFAFGFSPEAKAQIVTATKDSIVVSTDTTAQVKSKNLLDRSKNFVKDFDPNFTKNWSKPAKAAFYSAILPGAGQFYNKSYWKIPLIYATGAVLGFFIIDNNNKYQRFANAYRLRTDGDSTTIDEYANHPGYGVGLIQDYGTKNLQRNRDYFRKYRDLNIIMALVAHGLNVMEAHVDAHLKGFDVSDDLSLRIKPDIQRVPTSPYTPMLTLQFDFKK